MAFWQINEIFYSVDWKIIWALLLPVLSFSVIARNWSLLKAERALLKRKVYEEWCGDSRALAIYTRNKAVSKTDSTIEYDTHRTASRTNEKKFYTQLPDEV